MTKRRAATKAERDRAYRLRARLKAGKRLKAPDKKWLARYEHARADYAVQRLTGKPPPSAATEAIAIARWLAGILDGDDDLHRAVRYRWERPSTPTRSGIAIANVIIADGEGVSIDAASDSLDNAPELRFPIENVSDRNMNVRALIAIEGDEQWTSLLASTAQWDNAPNDLIRTLADFHGRYRVSEWSPEEAVIIEISIQVAPRARKKEKRESKWKENGRQTSSRARASTSARSRNRKKDSTTIKRKPRRPAKPWKRST